MQYAFSSLAPRFVALAALTSSALSAQRLGEVPRVDPGPSTEAGAVLEWTTAEGQEYWYRLPKKRRAGQKPALILMLHGTGLNHGWSFWNYPIASGEFRGDDIVVSPDGLTPGNGDTFNFVQNKDDREQIANIIALFRTRFDVGNVYLYGHSQGAFFAYWFAGEHPELVDGIVAHAGNVLADVNHSKLAKEKLAIGILHARSDQVVPVTCAETTHAFYTEQGYTRLKCWIVEGIRDEAGHWPLPMHVSEMFNWLDSVCTNDAAQAVHVAASALLRDMPDLTTAVRVAGEARANFKRYRGADAAAVEAKLELVERALDQVSEAVWSQLRAALAEHDGGTAAGPWAADVRWARRELGALPAFETATKPYASLWKKDDKALVTLAKIKNRDDKKYARAPVDALSEAWLAAEWDAVFARESQRVNAGWDPTSEVRGALERIGQEVGTGPSEPIQARARDAVRTFLEANPTLGDG